MDSQNGGLSSEQKQRQAAAEIARRKVLMAYEDKEVQTAVDFIKKQDKAIYSFDATQNANVATSNQQQASKNVLGASATPVLRSVSNEDWKKYHTAWQDYYQKYYSEYYMNAAKEYVAKTQVKQIRKQAEEEAAKKKYGEAITENGASEESGEKQAPVGLKAHIRAKALEKEKASRRRKLTPIFAGLAVVFTILFLQYNRLIFAPIAAYVSPGESPAGEITAVDPTVTLTKVSSENKLIIPKLNVDVPLNFGYDASEAMSAMNHGVVHYRINGASAYPGEIGNFVVLGHSAGDVYSANQYKFIFSGLERLEEGDIIYVHYNSMRYTYKMVGREIILPTEVEKLTEPKEVPTLLMVTCWPLGTSQKRLVIHAEQISPSTTEATKQEEVVEEKTDDNELPKNEDTLFERFVKWITGQ